MLTILCGTAKESKLQYMLNTVNAAAAKSEHLHRQNIVWLTPDQFTFETERSLIDLLPPSTRRKMIVTGFLRFAGMLMKQYGGVAGRYADNLCKTVLMRKAVADARDLLRVYQKQTASFDLQFEAQLLGFVRQLKFSGITPDDLQKAAEDPSLTEHLRAKAADLATLAMHYEARLSAAYRDSLDDLSAANDKLMKALESGSAYFADKTVILDGFKSFTAPQYDMIRMMLRQGAEVFVSLQLDFKEAMHELHSIYALTLDTYDRLLSLTGGSCNKLDFMPQAPQNALQAVGQNLFLTAVKPFAPDESVQLYQCRDEFAEAEYCFAKIKSMIKDSGGSLRLRDIAVVYREESEYLFPILSAAQKYEIPYCVDGGTQSENEPLFLVCSALLHAAYRQFDATDMLCIIKSGLFPCEAVDAAQLEEYLYVWQAKTLADWKRPFTAKLTGYSSEEYESAPLGDGPELLRGRLMTAVERLKEQTSGTGKQYGKLLYEVLLQLGVLSAVEQLCEQTEDMGEQLQNKRIWNTFGEILTRLSDVLAEDVISGEEYAALFLQSVKETKIKSVGQTIDCVLVGSAQSIRLQNPKVLWILGANDGIFPKRPQTGGGLFTDTECKQFSALELQVGKTLEERMMEERFIAYQMVGAAREKLFVSYRSADLGGTNRLESEIVWRLEAMFGQKARQGELSQSERMTSVHTVFDSYCALVRSHPQEASLYLDLLRKIPDGRYDSLIDTVEHLLSPKRYVLTSEQTIAELYTLYERMVSPSEIEQYFACPFAYFVKYGLKLKVRERAAYNPLLRGNILHHVVAILSEPISRLAKAHAKAAAQDGILPESVMIKAELSAMVEKAFDEEMDKLFENPGRISAKDKALAQSMKLRILRVAENIYAEQLQSKFAVTAVEFDIGKSPIMPLAVDVGDRSLRIRGRVDRLDTYHEENQTFFRIIDYKTGEKKFEYAKLLNGEHLQMILYEMAVASGGRGGFAGMLPAGVLYYPAKEMTYLKDRHAAEEERKAHFESGYRMDGIVVDEAEKLDRVRAMEAQLRQYYIPVGYNKYNEIDTDALCSLEEFRKIEQFAKSRVRKMAREVSAGVIDPIYQKDKNVCKYCKYSSLCGNDIRTESSPDLAVDEKQAQQIIMQQEESAWN